MLCVYERERERERERVLAILFWFVFPCICGLPKIVDSVFAN